MATIKCETRINYLDRSERNVLVFGRIAHVRNTAPGGYTVQCIAEDKDGNRYEIYTDYDACLVRSDAVAVPIDTNNR